MHEILFRQLSVNRKLIKPVLKRCHESLSLPVTVRSRNRKRWSPLAALDVVLSTLWRALDVRRPQVAAFPRAWRLKITTLSPA